MVRTAAVLAAGIAIGATARPASATTRATARRVLAVLDRSWWWFSHELHIALDDDTAEPMPDPALHEADDTALGLAVLSVLDDAAARKEQPEEA